MKRNRQDPHEYLGGDLPSETIGMQEDDAAKQLSKRERNELRKKTNKQWRLVDRKIGSGIDPNPRHTLYFKTQLPMLQSEHEWIKFQQALINPLPVTFRIGSSSPILIQKYCTAKMEREFKTLQGRFFELDGIPMHGKRIVHKIGWMPNNVFQICCDSATLARESALAPLSSYLRREVSLGHIVRQEMASMLPALLLDVKPHHSILDVCAAPGSKTEQLLHLLGGDSPGMVVANDADPKRIETLRKRYNRCGSPNLLIINSRAEELSKVISRKESRKFDRIVADVPCSGDGTIRKFPHIWRLFRPRIALELHSIQLQIAIATVGMLKAGGRMVYSTCSINPLEDEAVVSALLQHFKGALRLVQATLPGLQSHPGLSSWQVSEDVFTIGEPDAASRKASLERLPKLLPTMYPPAPDAIHDLHLEYCHRILPHDQDMGGFFVAVLELQDERGGVKGTFPEDSHRALVVSKEKSALTMRRLGYNPAIVSGERDKVSYAAAEAPVSLSMNTNAASGKYHLVQSTRSRHSASAVAAADDDEREGCESDDDKDDDDGNGIFGSQRNGWHKVSKHSTLDSSGTANDEDKCFVSLVSNSVYTALQTWAGPKIDTLQAGVELGTFGLTSHKFTPHPDNARMSGKYSIVSRATGVSKLVLGLTDFIALCKHGAAHPTASKDLSHAILSKCSSFDSVLLVEPADDEHTVHDALRNPTNPDTGKRRLSKAEKKRLRTDHAQPSVSANKTEHISSSTVGGGSSLPYLRGMVVVLRIGDDDTDDNEELYYVSAPDMLASYTAALCMSNS